MYLCDVLLFYDIMKKILIIGGWIMKVTFLGHSVVLIEKDGFKAIIDPFITGNELCPIKADELNDLTHIFITHGHSDHMGDCVELAKKCDATVIANHEIAHYLTKKGLDVHSMHIGGKFIFDFGSVKMTPALHGSGIEDGDDMLYGGNPCGFLIEIDGKKLYHAGDTGLTMDMRLLEDEHIDLAFLPIGGNFTMDVKDAARACEFIKPDRVVPMHYDTFDLIKADPNKFKKRAEYAEVVILNPGDIVEL